MNAILKDTPSQTHELSFPSLEILLEKDYSKRAEHNKKIKDTWKSYVKNNDITASHMLARNILLGYDLKRGFSPITNPNKLANGHRAYGALERALSDLLNEKNWSIWFSEDNLKNENFKDLQKYIKDKILELWRNQ